MIRWRILLSAFALLFLITFPPSSSGQGDDAATAKALNQQVVQFLQQGRYADAIPLAQKTLAIREKALGPDHPDVAAGLNNLAGLYGSLGDYAKAEPLYRRSLAIWEKALGSDHPNVATGLNSLALLYAALDEFRKAHDLHLRAQAIDERLIDQVMGFTSEDQKLAFLGKRKWNLNGFLSLIAQYLSKDQGIRKDALDVWLRRKGVILEAQKRFQEALVYSDDPQAIKTFQDLAGVRAQISKLVFAGPGKDGPEVHQKRIADLEGQKSRLEARLSQLSQAFASQRKIAKADSEAVAKVLPKNTALVEFARVDMFNFKAKVKEKRWLPAHYLAFVLHPGKGERIGMIDLGDADDIDRAVSLLKKEVGDAKDNKGEKGSKASQEVHAKVFDPLRKELGDVREVFISPDGGLNLIPFEILQGPDGRYLIEDYTFNYLAAGRDIIGFGEIKERGTKALIMGDPDFDMGMDEKDSTLRRLALRGGKEEVAVKRSSDMRDFHFTRLPSTREEVESIQALLGKDKADIHTGKEALEEVLRQKGTPLILHLATHGFFLNDLDLNDLADETMTRGIAISARPTGKKIKIENPLLRSGIVLAGANNALKSQDSENNTGIVTAEKILGLRLRGTDMVVLSACDTGIGEAKAGEGVFGLRRAFTQAGAKSLVMSMWAVPDKETKELMVEFYSNIQSGKMNRCQALRQAAIKEMEVVRERYGYANPFYWGAFVFMGEP
ncbi:MAG: CHAT domain-containing tetratricopeptide repeat protein [Pseudomonadota bacterium]